MSVPFKTTLVDIDIHGKKFSMETVINIDELFNELASRPDHDPEVKDERIPYWAELWPAAIVMARFLVQNAALVNRKKIIELGCGLGLSGIVAGHLGGNVLMTDYQQAALDFAAKNWKRNNNEFVQTCLLDWREPALDDKFDLVIAADVAYERKMFRPLVNTIKKALKPGGVALITEPNRRFAKDFLVQLRDSGFEIETATETLSFRNAMHTVHLHQVRPV